jgi:hypothetical protein
MNAARFEEIWMKQVAAEKEMLLERAAAYATHGDRLGNFYEGGQLNGCHPIRYGFSLVSKHIIALRDLMIKIDAGTAEFSEYEFSKLREYVTDIRNYSVLIEALYLEHQEKAPAAND